MWCNKPTNLSNLFCAPSTRQVETWTQLIILGMTNDIRMQDFTSVSNTSSVQYSGLSHKNIFYKGKQTNQDMKTFFVRFLALQKNQNTETTLWKQIMTVKYTLLLKKDQDCKTCTCGIPWEFCKTHSFWRTISILITFPPDSNKTT